MNSTRRQGKALQAESPYSRMSSFPGGEVCGLIFQMESKVWEEETAQHLPGVDTVTS